MTKIEWVKNPDGTKGETWNPVTGCTKISAGCVNCYAERMARRLAGRCGYPPAPHHFDVTLHRGRLTAPFHWRKPRMVFVCSMGDLFHEDVPFGYISRVYDVMIKNPQHTFQVLTKRAARMSEWYVWSGWNDKDKIAPNIWVGVTTENQEMANQRIPLLLQVPAAVRFISCEPLLSEISLWCNHSGVVGDAEWDGGLTWIESLGWAICGGESGYNSVVRDTKLEWVRALRDQCNAAGIPFFLKQLREGYKMIKMPYLDEKQWAEMPEVCHG